MNWKVVVGVLLVVGAVMETFSVVKDYRSGKLSFWPFGVEIGFVLIVALGVYLINKVRKEKEADGLRKL